MENVVKLLSISNSELEWNRLSKEIVPDLKTPQILSIFPNENKHLCESAIDLVCSGSSRPCSG